MAKLEVKNLTISFRTNNGAVRAVRDISFSLGEGETLAVAGESGSGKSVTARAVMGILAGNAIVEGGEIIYDGRDLLKIPEEEFHALRGHRLAMVFQDPLSALNPIMHIGKQLTEAMILNNKERRRDGKKRFDALTKQLEQESPAIKDDMARFKKAAMAAAEAENKFETARESAQSVLDTIEEIEEAMLKKDAKTVKERAGHIKSALDGARNEHIKLNADAACEKAVSLCKDYSKQQDEALTGALNDLKAQVEAALHQDTPDFFKLTWEQGSADSFLDAFTDKVASAVASSRQKARGKRGAAVAALKEALPVFERETLDKSACIQAADKAAKAVRESIDPLSLEKDNKAYVFASSLKHGIERYFDGVKRNPIEEKRFARDTMKYNDLVRKGKSAASVVPMNLTDFKRTQGDMVRSIRELISHYEAGDVSRKTDREEAEAILKAILASAKDCSYRLSQATARHRAIELMKEVGIPQPHKRFDQYPFEFSGGMRQRIVIAIALSANPDILICDEPTTALDVTIQAQILELINRLKRERNLSVIFITHDLGVVANMADRIAVMYAGKIVEYGTADDVFYDPKHPYTWALLASMPDLETKEKLAAIPGTPPNMIVPPKGDAFAARNRYAMQIDLEEQPPMFKVSDTHWAATWLLHPDAPKVEPPAIVLERIERMRRAEQGKGGERA